jgi:hypothetical protein
VNWDGKAGRCDMYCKGLSDEDWRFLCDCFEVDRVLGEENLPDPGPSVDRCDKCGTPIDQWDQTPCVQSLTQSPRHTITRFYLDEPSG